MSEVHSITGHHGSYVTGDVIGELNWVNCHEGQAEDYFSLTPFRIAAVLLSRKRASSRSWPCSSFVKNRYPRLMFSLQIFYNSGHEGIVNRFRISMRKLVAPTLNLRNV